jgi:hypothetical protein
MLTESIARELMPSDELPVTTYRLVFDGGSGLALQVLPSGYKGWLWQGRTPDGRMVRLTHAQRAGAVDAPLRSCAISTTRDDSTIRPTLATPTRANSALS